MMTALPRPSLRVVRGENDHDADAASRAGGIQHALVCLDRSPASELCLPYAQIVAEAFGAAITLTHVMPSQKPSSGSWSRTDGLDWELERREADQYLELARERLAHRLGPSVRTALTQGVPADRIVATAREVGADLTIVASDAPLVPHAGLVGGTAQRVLAMSRGSVLLAQGSASVPPQRIVVPLDGSARTESVLPAALSLARAYGAELSLVHIVCEPPATLVLADPDDITLSQQLTRRLEKSAERYLERLRAGVLREVPSVRLVVRVRADERRALLDLATQLRADLIVMAAHGSTCDVDNAFGSVVSYMLARSRVPLLVLQDVTRYDEAAGPSQAPRRVSQIRRKEDV